MLHDLDPQAWRAHMQGPMQGVMDFLSQNYTPEQLSKVSVPDAWRGSAAWHEALAKKKAEALEDPFAGTQPHKEYPSGYKWVKFDPESPVLEEALKGEGDVMGHCVGGYCDDVRNQSSHIYSLRDPKGEAHVTVEVNPQQNPESARLNQGAGPQGFDISQIKGKGNKKPADQYLPYVQDFVRSGKWGDVGDLQNTGLQRFEYPTDPIKRRSPKGVDVRSGYATPKELEQFKRYKWGDSNEWITEDEHVKRSMENPHWAKMGEEWIRKALRGRPFGDREGINGARYDIPDDWQPGSIPGMAEGGELLSDTPGTHGYSNDIDYFRGKINPKPPNQAHDEDLADRLSKLMHDDPKAGKHAESQLLDFDNRGAHRQRGAIPMAEGGEVSAEDQDALDYLNSLLNVSPGAAASAA
jgi:hypothetical protein